MSDQVEIVAAEDAPGNIEGGEVEVSAQSTPEQPETKHVASVSESAPLAEVSVAISSEASSEGAANVVMPETAANEEEALVSGPVGEVLDGSNTDTTSEGAANVIMPEAAANEEEALVSGPVGEVLDDSNTDTTSEGAANVIMPEAAANEEEALVSGPVGEVLDDSNTDTTSEAVAESVSEIESEIVSESLDDGTKSNVRILSVGQQITGTVKRIADFGAFVDIGVGRDGLIHISELSVRRVGKVTDVLAEGQEVIAWIKKLDRDRNRISLTLIDPNTKTIRDLNKDDLVQGTVTRILPYGAFVDIGIGRDALLHVREMGVGYVAKPEDVVKVGDSIEARIIELSRRRGRVDLSLKGLRDEPEPTPAPQVAQPQPQQQQSNARHQPEPEPEEEDDFENLEVLSPMELAFKRAMEAEGMEMNVNKKKQGKRNRRERNRSLQDEIVTRTLSSSRK